MHPILLQTLNLNVIKACPLVGLSVCIKLKRDKVLVEFYRHETLKMIILWL